MQLLSVNIHRILSVVMIFICINANAQLTTPGMPESFLSNLKSSKIIPEKILEAIDTGKLAAYDRAVGIDNRYGIVGVTDIDLKRDGIKTEIEGKGNIWQYKLTSVQSYSLGIFFTKFVLPSGASVFIYNENHTQLAGAFTDLNNNSQNQLMISDFQGQQLIIEYFEPLVMEFSGNLKIGFVSQAYKNIIKATSGRVNINCPEGAKWQDVKHSVCRMTYNDTKYSYLCTGFLINNLRIDGTPYFETANHCISTAAEASTLITYFNYENSTCTSSDAKLTSSLSGATIKATSSYSDFTLLLLNEFPPESYSPYFAGWDASGKIPLNGTCIHHPAGVSKCISLGSKPAVSYDSAVQWTDANEKVISTTVPNTHWMEIFEIGTTEGGSSGSPMFNENQRAVGQLHGGNDNENYYGKFSLSWNFNTASDKQLKIWLDPDNSGKVVLDGTYMHIAPKSTFSTIFHHECIKDTVVFTDKSRNAPNQWEWSITPITCHFVNGTDKNSQNIKVVFDNPGFYAIVLKASNPYGFGIYSDTVHTENIHVAFKDSSSDSIVCGCNLIKYPLSVSGANTYSYKIQLSSKFIYSTDSSHLYLNLLKSEHKNGSFNTWLTTTGTLGNCTAKDSLLLKVRMPINDDVENSITLHPGRNGSFTNFCASPQTNEPFPPLNNCYSNNGWCSDTAVNTLKHTIWFTFRPPTFGQTSIDTHGFNDRIAVYEADSYENVLNKNSQLIGANDDRSATDNTAIVDKLNLTKDKVYWLQVDGSKNEIGNCIIDFLSNSIEIYPNPSTGLFNVIISNDNDGLAQVNVYNYQGTQIIQNAVNVTKENTHFTLDLSNYSSGIYVLNIKLNGISLTSKIMVVK